MSSASEITFEQVHLKLKGRSYVLEIADTQARRNQGLMHREMLHQGAGMLFLYPKPGHYRIWMKNTRIPLTVIWLDKQARIVQIRTLQPCQHDPCLSYGTSQQTSFIVELAASQKPFFQVGDRLPALLPFLYRSIAT